VAQDRIENIFRIIKRRYNDNRKRFLILFIFFHQRWHFARISMLVYRHKLISACPLLNGIKSTLYGCRRIMSTRISYENYQYEVKLVYQGLRELCEELETVGRAKVVKNSTNTEISVFVFVSAKNLCWSCGMLRKIVRRGSSFAKFAPSVSELGTASQSFYAD